MSRIVWDRPQDRRFEAGVDKGVLYVNHGTGVPWNGLISVTQTMSEGVPEGRYQDGVKTHNHTPYQEFESTITAFTYPNEFEECLGMGEVHEGFYVGEQARTNFGMSYQSRVGSGSGSDYNRFKINLIYNAVATPNDKTYDTIGESPELSQFSWGLKTASIPVPGFRPASHFVLDPSKIGPSLFSYIYDLLYGAPGITPRLLMPDEILDIADNWEALYPSPNTYPSLATRPGGP